MKLETILNMVENKRNITFKSQKMELSMSNSNMILYTMFNIDGAEFYNEYKMDGKNCLYTIQNFSDDYLYFLSQE